MRTGPLGASTVCSVILAICGPPRAHGARTSSAIRLASAWDTAERSPCRAQAAVISVMNRWMFGSSSVFIDGHAKQKWSRLAPPPPPPGALLPPPGGGISRNPSPLPVRVGREGRGGAGLGGCEAVPAAPAPHGRAEKRE